ncbi:MAG: PAS domain-containing protein [Polyangiaceae bacterium]|nr:PAS domain-containing protein [Polyangiaceae bacterium]
MKPVIVSATPLEELGLDSAALPSGIHERPGALSPSELMRSAFLDAAAPIAVESPAGALLCVNAAFEQLLGVRAERLIGESLGLALAGEDQLRLSLLRENCLGGEDQVGVEFTVTDSQRVEHLMLVTASLLTDVEGEALAISYHFQDVGLLKARLRESDRALAKVEALSKAEKTRLELSREQVFRAEAKVQRLESLLIAQQRIYHELSRGSGSDAVVDRVMAIVCPVGGFKVGEFWRGKVSGGRALAFRQAEFVADQAFAFGCVTGPGAELAFGVTAQWENAEQQLLFAHLKLEAEGLALASERVLLVEVRTEDRWFGVLRFMGGEPSLDASVGRMLEQVGLRLGDYLANKAGPAAAAPHAGG